ncbi:endoglucanase IV precursor [Ophiobolus disseminans]|uniref:Endoglucanase IV n=1 Tax=Ophiobolus disseminans TaxID=1469910 RepID=A0A6A6ZJB0_9PLEO|nr:endoglucanase IV precursor [Ophiobolus disseminans]
MSLLCAFISTIAGHTFVEKFEAGGKTYKGFRQASKRDPGNQSPAWWTNQGWGLQPIYGDKLSHPDIIAHRDASPSPYTAEVIAGSKVIFHWYHEGTCGSGSGESGWDCSHHGFTATYLAICKNSDCSKVDKTQLQFFKIHQAALIDYRAGRYSRGSLREQVGYWRTDAIFYNQGNTQCVVIPRDIPNGNYVLWTEVTSVHNNGEIANRQFWPQAFNVKIIGSLVMNGTSVPDGKKGTELYSAGDALLQWNMSAWHLSSHGTLWTASPRDS